MSWLRSYGRPGPGLLLAWALGLALLWASHGRAADGVVDGAPLRLKVATYNVFFRNTNGVALAEFLRSMGADFLALQETTPTLEAILRPALKTEYPHQHYVTAPGSGGCAVLSRFPIENLQTVAPTGSYRAALVGRTRLNPTQTLPFAVVHLVTPRFGKVNSLASALQTFSAVGEGQDVELRRVLVALDALGPGIVLGDFNSFSFGPAQQILRDRGWIDSLLAVDPEADRRITWKGNKQTKMVGGRIDYLWHAPVFKTLECRVVEGVGSDHSPVLSILEWSGKAGANAVAP